jgi:regulator of sirC expression with transglutaminase-like and TPR domain
MDLQNRQVLRLLAYRLQQAGEVDNAFPLFERVLELAPNEPQSHRDLGLALAEAGQAQKAVDRLYEVATGAGTGASRTST